MASKYRTFPGAIGSGGFGTVYKVTDGHSVFAKKVINLKAPSLSRSEESVKKRILSEIQGQKKACTHENVVKMYEVFEEDHGVALILEFCELGNLNDYVVNTWIKKTKAIPGAVRRSFFLDMSKGVQHLHRKGIVHRDLKPDNVLLVKGKGDVPACKLGDFGLAKLIDEETGSDPTKMYMQTGCGTVLFVAPEVWKRHYTQQCDAFSLGVIFYSLFTLATKDKLRLWPQIDGKFLYETSDDQLQTAVKTSVRSAGVASKLSEMLRHNYKLRPTADEIVSFIESTEAAEFS